MSESTTKKKPLAGQRLADIDIIKELAISLLRRSTLDDLLWDIAEAIGKMPGFEDSVVYLREGDSMVQRAAYGLKRNEDGTLNEPISIPVGSGIVGSVASSGIPEIIPDISKDSRYIFDLYAGQSELAVPVSFEGRVIAVLDTESKVLNAYSQADLDILQTMANISAARIGSALVEQERLRVSRELAELNAQLEHRVASRTQDLEQANADIQRERDRLESILNSIQDGMISFDQEGTIRLMSPSASELTGWPAEEAIGRDIASVFVPASENERSNLFQVDLNSPRETVTQARDGRLRDVRWTLGESSNGAGAEKVLVFSDVTTQKQLAKQAEQVQRMESLGILAGGIAHDFNNNLTAIQSAMESISGDDSKTAAALELSRVACDSARSLAKQLLTFSNGGAPVRRPTDLKSLIEKSVTLVLEPMSVATIWQPADFDISVDVDPDQMSQVFSNLLLNAAQAMSGKGVVRLNVATPEESSRDGNNGLVEVRIQDEGIGIPEENLESIFDPYFTSKPEGNGLGLTISYHVLKRHDGSLGIENCSGGAMARVRIPLSSRNAESPVKRTEVAATASANILLLEDEPLVRNGIRMLLESLGHKVLESTHGDEAVEMLEDAYRAGNSVDLMILDLCIKGGKGGAEILPKLRAVDSRAPILACSGYHRDPIMSDAKANGFDGALPKPFRRETLIEVLGQFLHRP